MIIDTMTTIFQEDPIRKSRLLEGPSEIKKPKSNIIQDKGQVTNVN